MPPFTKVQKSTKNQIKKKDTVPSDLTKKSVSDAQISTPSAPAVGPNLKLPDTSIKILQQAVASACITAQSSMKCMEIINLDSNTNEWTIKSSRKRRMPGKKTLQS